MEGSKDKEMISIPNSIIKFFGYLVFPLFPYNVTQIHPNFISVHHSPMSIYIVDSPLKKRT